MKNKISALLFLSFFFFIHFNKEAKACHAIALVNVSITVLPNGINCNASSDSPTCGCGNYWLDVEVQCNGCPWQNPCTSTNAYGPFVSSGTGCYGSTQMAKPNCVVQAYPTVFIPFAGLCPGIVYKVQMREHHATAVPPVGPWSATFTFTVPGSPPTVTSFATANPTTICPPQTSQLNCGYNVNPTCTVSSCPVGYSWVPAGSLNNAAIQNPVASPTTTTTYTVYFVGGCVPIPPATVTVTVSPPPIAGTASVNPTSVCPGQNVTLTLTGFSGNIQWQSGPTSTGPWTNIVGATTSSYVFGPVNSNTCFHAVVTNSCGSVTSNVVCVTVNGNATITVTPSAPNICIGNSTSLTANGANTYSWSPATNLSSTTGATVTANPTVTTTYTVTGTTSSGCTGTATVTVTVNPLPTITINPNAPSICSGSSTTLTASGASTYSWAPATNLSSTTGATVTANPTVTTTYTVTGTTAAGCTNTATVTVTVNPLPTVTVNPPNPSYCTGGNVNLTASGANTYSWSPATGLSATTGATVNASPTVTTTYTVTGTSAAGCTATATVTVTVNSSITVTVNPSAPSICIGSSTTLTANGGTTYSWAPATNLSSTTSATVTANPTVTTTYTVTGTSGMGCTGTATVTVTVNPLPTVTVNPAAPSYCIGGNTNLTASGASTYSWSPATSLSATTGATVNASPTVTTTYTVTGTSAAGCTSTATVTVTVYPLPTITINPNAPTVCPNIPVVLNAGGASTYVWAPATFLSATTGASVTCTPSTTITYTVTGTSVNGCTSTATVTVTVMNNFVVTATPSDTICMNSSLPLTCTAGASYAWSPSTGLSCTTCQNPTASPTTTTTYSVTVTTAQGCTGSTTVTITVDPALTLAIAGFPENCAGACDGQAVVIPNGGMGNPSFVWSNGGTAASISPVCPGTYTVTVTDQVGCTATANTTVNAAPPLVLTSAVTTAHCNQSDGSATVTATGGTGNNYTYSWTCTPSQSTATASNIPTGNYCCYVKDGNQCLDTICVFVPNAAGVVASICTNVPPTCFGGNDGSLTCCQVGGNGPYTYNWSTFPSQTTATATGLTQGTYTCLVTDANGCTDTAVAVVTQPTQVTVTPMAAQTICIGQCVTLTATGAGGTPGYTYSWNVNNANVCPVVTTTYTVVASDANGCASQPQTVTITVNPALSVAVGNGSGICPGASTTITATASGGSGSGYGYSWAPATGLSCQLCQSPVASPSATTTYTVFVTDNCGTPSVQATITVVVYALPVVAVTADTNQGCVPLCINLQDLSTINSGTITNWSWTMTGANPASSTQQNPQNICYTIPGTYSITLVATSNNGCTASLNLPYVVNAFALPVANFSYGPSDANILDPRICFTDSSMNNIMTWSWNFGDPTSLSNTDSVQNPCHTYGDTGTYCVTLNVMNNNGCTDSIQYCLHIDPDFVIFVPNAFTPNGDGNNETFFPQGTGIDPNNFKMWIYDRWGNNIFYTEKLTKGWDGTVNGNSTLVQEDVYVWRIELKDFKGDKHVFVGHVSMIK
ncbi:MAG TPA: PKD domain-containing protein [Bacteroidia bacterium]